MSRTTWAGIRQSATSRRATSDLPSITAARPWGVGRSIESKVGAVSTVAHVKRGAAAELEAMSYHSIVGTELQGETFTLIKQGTSGRPWVNPETDEKITSARAAQLGFTTSEESIAA